VATVVGSLPGGPRGLAGAPPPQRCHDPADCPPDFPGCPAYAFVRPPCSSDSDCDYDSFCEWDGYCTETEPAGYGEWELVDDDERLARAVRRAKHRFKSGYRSRAPAARAGLAKK